MGSRQALDGYNRRQEKQSTNRGTVDHKSDQIASQASWGGPSRPTAIDQQAKDKGYWKWCARAFLRSLVAEEHLTTAQ
jgi:hypothetical protein